MNVNSVISSKEIAPLSGSTPVETGKANEIKNAEVLQKETIEKEQKTTPAVEEMKDLASELNEYMDDLQTDLGFSINEKLDHQVIVEIKNRNTDELVKQIPSEELVAIREKMAELTGLLFDKSV